MKRFLILLVCLISWPAPAAAQVNVDANVLRLGSAPCAFSTGSGAPSSGNVCDAYIDTSTGDVYEHKSSGNWIKLIDSWASHNLLIGEGASVAPSALAGCTNAVPWWSSSSVDPTCQTSPTLTGVSITSGNVQTTNYASQTTGWGITAAGAADFRYLFANELRILLFTAEQEAVLAGAQRVSKSYSTISQTFTCPSLGSTSTLWVNDSPTFANAAVFVSGDSVFIHALSRTALGGFSVSDCVGQVTSYTDGTGGNDGQQSWTFTRYSGGGGANGGSMTGGTTVAVNQLVQDLGVSGNGYVETIADDGSNNVNAPYTQIVTWASAPIAANTTVRCRLGQLTGITSTSEYGLLCGNYGGNAYVRFSDQHAEIKGIPLTLLSGSTPTIKIDPTGPDIALGNPVPTALMTGTGIWMDGTGAFRAGNPSGDYLEWDTSHLSLVSSNLTINNTVGVQIAISTTGSANTFAYGFSTGFSAGNSIGLFGAEVPASGLRLAYILNNTTATGKITETILEAASNGHGPSLSLIADDTVPDNYIQSNVRIEPSANNSADLGTSSLGWRTGYFGTSVGIGIAPAYPFEASLSVNSSWEGAFINANTAGHGLYVAAGTTSANIIQAWYQHDASTLEGEVLADGTWAKNTSSTWTIISDQKTKKNIVPMTGALAKIRQVQLHEYDYNGIDNTVANQHGVGVIAQEVQTIFPNSVQTMPVTSANGPTGDTVLMFNAHELFMNAVGAVIELDQQVQALTARVAALEAKTKNLPAPSGGGH